MLKTVPRSRMKVRIILKPFYSIPLTFSILSALNLLKQDPSYATRLADQEALELCRLEESRRSSDENHRAWLEREQVAQFEFQQRRQKEEENDRRLAEKRAQLLRDYEAAEAKKRLVKEQRQKAEEEILLNHQRQLQEVKNYIEGTSADVPLSLLGLIETNPTADECQYFAKTAVCRFGTKCSRKHVQSKLSSVLLIKHFFRSANFTRGHALARSEDIIENSLEVNREFNEFFNDACGELERFGQLLNVAVCTNSAAHIVGNTLVEYASVKSALAACYHLNGRFYGGQKLAMEFCHNFNWRTAVCGRYEEGRRRRRKKRSERFTAAAAG